MIWKHIGGWIIAFLVCALMIPAISSQDAIMGRVIKEVQMIDSALGGDATRQITSEATAAYNAIFVNSGVVTTTNKAVVTADEQKSSEKLFGGSLTAFSGFTNSYIRGMSAMFYASMVRLLIIIAWLPYIAPFFVAVVLDAVATRKVKLATFGYASPMLFSAGQHVFVVMLMLPILYLLVPLPVTPLLIPFWVLFAAAPLMLLISNAQQITS